MNVEETETEAEEELHRSGAGRGKKEDEEETQQERRRMGQETDMVWGDWIRVVAASRRRWSLVTESRQL